MVAEVEAVSMVIGGNHLYRSCEALL